MSCVFAGFVGFGYGLWKEKLGNENLGDLSRCYGRRKLTSDAYVRRLESTLEGILGQDFKLVQLQRGKRDSFDGILVLKLGHGLPIGPLPQAELIYAISKTNGHTSLLIDGAPSEDGEGG
jgi:hypothetical protein